MKSRQSEHKSWRAWILAGFVLAFSAGAAEAGEFYYAMIFGSESSPKRLRKTHTWATFVRAVGEGPDPSTYALEFHTISWLPATLKVKVLRPWAEPGVNLDLYQSLAAMYAEGESVTMWGPFVANEEIWKRSLAIRNIIDSGAPRYRAISNSRDMLIADCIHAVAAVDPQFGRNHYPLIRIGKPASRYMARQVMMRSVYDQWQYDNSWLIPRLGLDRYPIEVVAPQRIPKEDCGLCIKPD